VALHGVPVDAEVAMPGTCAEETEAIPRARRVPTTTSSSRLAWDAGLRSERGRDWADIVMTGGMIPPPSFLAPHRVRAERGGAKACACGARVGREAIPGPRVFSNRGPVRRAPPPRSGVRVLDNALTGRQRDSVTPR